MLGQSGDDGREFGRELGREAGLVDERDAGTSGVMKGDEISRVSRAGMTPYDWGLYNEGRDGVIGLRAIKN